MSDTIVIGSALGAGLNPDQAQRVYRAVLEAFARPGTVQTLPRSDFPAALLPALALADLETGTHVLEPGQQDWTSVLAVATGAPATPLETAKYVTALRPPTATEFGSVTTGTALSPESAATVVCAVDAVDDGIPVRLAGPGIESEIAFAPAGFDPALWEVRRHLVAEFPSGVDLLLAGPDGSLVGIPRTTVVTTGKDN
ncbi:alpha-D-ribose 1-methylphosphonate 5-triphosphate synthase subunit PhnH [Rhodococcus wratislaviensis]|uniref:Carbon-phosphorus lyase complex subunit n=1 Tax=Rhodococcus wratislaviensis TaxID=44752 RepID=A0AB38FPH1_RHOWR|nr:phosphonate C-P lyase system protein PhnH [Rhodococcus wratislaviensis]REE75743.1 alpha-D-ribose 1-methylphosphonate 5-triphosphate synthase subunit PhnH [Rhodococcus wratislaviensis]SPZ43446.1 carbon-phosphorus lyase complex subunit [Rhodococcus wratislaviensis]